MDTAPLQAGDKVTPKDGDVSSNGGTSTIRLNQIVVVKAKSPSLLLVHDVSGIFNIKDFRKVESTPKETAENLRIPKKDAPNIATGSRKSLKKKFEKLTGRNLEWKNGYLCFLGTDARIPNSPYAPKE